MFLNAVFVAVQTENLIRKKWVCAKTQFCALSVLIFLIVSAPTTNRGFLCLYSVIRAPACF